MSFLHGQDFVKGQKMACPLAVSFETFSPSQVCDYLKLELPTLSQEVLRKLEEHKIDGEVFLGLNDEYLREVAPLLGDRLKIKRVIYSALTMSSSVS